MPRISIKPEETPTSTNAPIYSSVTQEIWQQGDMIPPIVYNSLITKSKDIEMVEIVNKEFKNLPLRMISDHKKGLK